MPTVHSARLGHDLHLGKQRTRAVTSDHVAMSDLLKAATADLLPPIPKHFGSGYGFGAAGWGMLGNGPDDTVSPGFRGCGDCDWAATAHVLMQAAKNAGRAVPPFSGRTVVAQYSAYSGYDPKTGANDNGTDMQESISWCQTKGFYDDDGTVYQLGQSISLTPGDLNELWAATYLFEDAKIGVAFTTAQMDQFDASPRPVWDYVAGSPEEGGHAIPTMGKTGLISWAERVGFTRAFIEHQMDEGFCFLLPERYSAVTGETREHLTDADLEKYLALLPRYQAAA